MKYYFLTFEYQDKSYQTRRTNVFSKNSLAQNMFYPPDFKDQMQGTGSIILFCMEITEEEYWEARRIVEQNKSEDL